MTQLKNIAKKSVSQKAKQSETGYYKNKEKEIIIVEIYNELGSCPISD